MFNARSASPDSAAMIPLSRDEIHLWLAYYDEIEDRRMRLHQALLNDAEKAQHLKFHFERDRRRYFATRVLVRTVLSRYAPVRPERWIFAANAYGRPEIANAGMPISDLSFNISHTNGLIVLGVTRGRQLGVDVENIRARGVSIEIADRFFSPIEVAALAEVASELQQDRFFEYWTLKESYIKARGMGLSIPLDKFGFRFPQDHAIELSIDPELQDCSERWQFWQLRPTPAYLVAICAERTEAGSPAVIVRKVVTMDLEQDLAVRFFRTSA
jgi:4'-phosphopantetheinyl transferase